MTSVLLCRAQSQAGPGRIGTQPDLEDLGHSGPHAALLLGSLEVSLLVLIFLLPAS